MKRLLPCANLSRLIDNRGAFSFLELRQEYAGDYDGHSDDLSFSEAVTKHEISGYGSNDGYDVREDGRSAYAQFSYGYGDKDERQR